MGRAPQEPQEPWAQLPALPQPFALEQVTFPPGPQFADLQMGGSLAWKARRAAPQEQYCPGSPGDTQLCYSYIPGDM